MSKVELNKELQKISMTADEDPVTLFVQMTSIETRYKITLEFNNKLAKILEVCPDKYKSEIASELRRIDPNDITIGDLRTVMHNYWRVLNIGRSVGSRDADTDKELGMAALADVTCNYCKKKGHMMKDCFALKNKEALKNKPGGPKTPGKPGAGKFQGKCNHCGKVGHKEVACWDKPNNNAKRPAWYKDLKSKDKRDEAGNAAVTHDESDDRVEYMMAGVEDAGTSPSEEGVCAYMRYNYEPIAPRHRSYVKFFDSDDEDIDDEANDPASINWVHNRERDPILDLPEEVFDSEGYSMTDGCEFYSYVTPEMDEGDAELGCAALNKLHSFPDSQKLLSHPNF
jgi:hypothetical protein